MTASIGTSTSATAQPTRAGADARPQVQSRRVSLKLGPLGITYSSDQVLWTETAVAAGISASAASGEAEGAEAKAPVSPAAALPSSGQESAAAQQTQQAQQLQEAQAAGRSFSLELAQAWRRQVEEKVRTEQTYDRGGAVRAKGSPSGSANGSGATQEAGPLDEAEAQRAAGTAGSAAATTGSAPAASSGTQQTRPPASRMRQAIGAYLACARNFSAPAPMLTAVA
jgi:hypothetical protein